MKLHITFFFFFCRNPGQRARLRMLTQIFQLIPDHVVVVFFFLFFSKVLLYRSCSSLSCTFSRFRFRLIDVGRQKKRWTYCANLPIRNTILNQVKILSPNFLRGIGGSSKLSKIFPHCSPNFEDNLQFYFELYDRTRVALFLIWLVLWYTWQ